MKKFIISFLLVQTAFSSIFAGVNDVVPKKFKTGSTYVRVTKVTQDKVKFEKCIKGYEQGTCHILGRKSAYKLKDLVKQRDIENQEVAGTITADVVIIAAAALTGGALAGGLFAGAAELGSGIWFIDAAGSAVYSGAVATGATTAGAMAAGGATLVNALNPALQIAQARTLNTNVLQDKLVVHHNIEDYINNLETVLEKIK